MSQRGILENSTRRTRSEETMRNTILSTWGASIHPEVLSSWLLACVSSHSQATRTARPLLFLAGRCSRSKARTLYGRTWRFSPCKNVHGASPPKFEKPRMQRKRSHDQWPSSVGCPTDKLFPRTHSALTGESCMRGVFGAVQPQGVRRMKRRPLSLKAPSAHVRWPKLRIDESRASAVHGPRV